MNSIRYLEQLKKLDIDPEIKDIILKQPYSERYVWLITENGVNCEYAKIIERHYMYMPINGSSFFNNIILDKDTSFRDFLYNKIKEKEGNELIYLKELIDDEKRKESKY